MEMEQRPEVLRAKCPGVSYTSYFKEEVAAIIDLIQAKSSSDEPSAPQSALGGGITQIVYHARHPKIGFVGKKTDSVVEELQKVLLAMEEFAREHGLTNLESNHESDGCHLCLHLGSVTTEDWNFTRKSGEDVLGYIVTTGPRFYQLCPVSLREDWFTAFQQSSFKCLT